MITYLDQEHLKDNAFNEKNVNRFILDWIVQLRNCVRPMIYLTRIEENPYN
jgi:hypothetical protein